MKQDLELEIPKQQSELDLPQSDVVRINDMAPVMRAAGIGVELILGSGLRFLPALVTVTSWLRHGEVQFLCRRTRPEPEPRRKLVWLCWCDDALKRVMILRARAQQQDLLSIVDPIDNHLGRQALGVLGNTQSHPLAVRRIDEFQQAIGQLSVHAEWVRSMMMSVAFACAD
jgi:hypothetical protein